MVIFIAITYIY